jgi:hypothetical protein
MPGPVITRTSLFPEWTKPENASVFDPAYRAPIRALISWLGLDDPQQAMMVGMPIELPGGPLGGAMGEVAKRFPRLLKALQQTRSGALPMDEASRLQRANALGFDTAETVYHGSNKRFSTFEPQGTIRNTDQGLAPVTPQAHYFSTDPETSRYFAKQRVRMNEELRGQPGGTPSVRKFYLRIENPLDLTITPEVRQRMIKDGYNPAYNPDALNPYTQRELENLTGYSFEDWNHVQQALDEPHVIQALRDAGYDGVRMREMSFQGDTLAVFDPQQIRSTKAAFDPRKTESGNILYGFLPVVAASQTESTPARQPQ